MTETAAPKKLIFNFRPFLADSILESIRETVGESTIANIRLQIQPNQSPGKVVKKTCNQAIKQYGPPDYLILPTNPEAAGFVARFFGGVLIIRLVPVAGPGLWAFGGVE